VAAIDAGKFPLMRMKFFAGLGTANRLLFSHTSPRGELYYCKDISSRANRASTDEQCCCRFLSSHAGEAVRNSPGQKFICPPYIYSAGSSPAPTERSPQALARRVRVSGQKFDHR
jgi:hypothetical protein